MVLVNLQKCEQSCWVEAPGLWDPPMLATGHLRVSWGYFIVLRKLVEISSPQKMSFITLERGFSCFDMDPFSLQYSLQTLMIRGGEGVMAMYPWSSEQQMVSCLRINHMELIPLLGWDWRIPLCMCCDLRSLIPWSVVLLFCLVVYQLHPGPIKRWCLVRTPGRP